MESVDVTKDQAKKAKKRSVDQLTVGTENKKSRLFFPKQFRKQLTQESSHAAVKQFFDAVIYSKNHDYITEYLDCGGSCLELLQTLELDSCISPFMVFELLSQVLLRINASCPQFQSAAYEACRYLINNYASVFSKMINLSSTTPERKACLKLLTAMVAFSSTLAKDILIHINFHSTNIELLTKHTGEKNSVRDHLIRFLTAYLMDVHFPALSVLLEKKGFITSIVKGLQFDSSDTLCLVISAMKNHLLENPSVSKTAKMRTFNTVVVRDIVNLYNWKGPGAVFTQKNKKTVNVDQIEKSKVNECVHEFLLVLCTSHKFGVIFKDPMMGLGKKNQNALMYTVLESLDRPWDHSYASELVLKICGACPDLAKTVWGNLKQFLAPRMSEKWLSAMKFAKLLVQELQPACTEFCMKDLNVMQIFQIVQYLVSPLPVIKTILPESNIFESPAIKYNVLLLLSEILKSLNTYLKSLKMSLSIEDFTKLKSYINNFVSRNFLHSTNILKDYENNDETPEYSQIQFLELAFEILEQYKLLSPVLLDSLSSENVDLSDLLKTVDSIAKKREIDTSSLKVKIINIFLDFDHSKFLPDTPLFSFVVPSLFRKYYSDSNVATLELLNKLLNNTGIFEECHYEINIWINAILNLKKFDETVIDNIIEILKTTSEHSQEFFDELYKFNSDTGTVRDSNILQNVINADVTSAVKSVVIKHKYLSPLALGLVKFSTEKQMTKGFKVYVNFVLMNLLHMQTRPASLLQVLNKCDFLYSSFREYATTWSDGQEVVALTKLKGKFEIFEKFSQEFLFGSVDNLLNSEGLNLIPDLLLNLLDASIFYVSNLLNRNLLSAQIVENCRTFVKHLVIKKIIDDVFIERLLGCPVLLNSITFLSYVKDESASIGTNFIVNIIKDLLESGYKFEHYLLMYRKKLLNNIMKILKKPHKYEELASNVKELLQLFDLSYDDCYSILSTISTSFEKYQKCCIALDILVYSVNQLTSLCRTNPRLAPLNENVVQNLSQYVVILANSHDIDLSNFSSAFLTYLEIFPHNLKNVEEMLFQALLEINEFNKENIKLAVFLLEKSNNYTKYVERNIDSICEKKGILLPLLTIVVKKDTKLELLQQIYDKFEKFLHKAIQKPQKAGQHFHQNYEGLIVLIEKCMPKEICLKYCEKIQKFEVTEEFHANLLSAVWVKSLSDEIDTKKINNIIVSFVHLQINVFKRGLQSDDEVSKTKIVATIFNNIIKEIKSTAAGKDFKNTCKNESVKLYCKYCLKFGISTPIFLKSLSSLLDILYSSMDIDDGRTILEMLLSHSEFLSTILGKYSEEKLEILSLFLDLCKNWPEFMERHHIPVLLASYGAMVNACDKKILTLFKMYESKADQTKFYDFQPFLWGKAAASHYSIKLQIENALWRQPKMGDVLEILQDDYVRATLINHPLNDRLHNNDVTEKSMTTEMKSYDLMFLLPLFSQLLAPEQQVQTYKFTRSGALSLTVVGLSSDDKQVRQAACHVLSRFYNHVEARQSGKDNVLWIRYVEAVCKGTAVLPDFKLNNFAAIYLARMALILTQPNNVMYLPLSQHLTAKSSLDFSTVPELYTFLHSSDVNFKEHRHFTLELVKDGLRTDKDFADLSRSMGFKLFSELYSSAASDSETRLAILEVVKNVCGSFSGAKQLCESHSLLTQLHGYVRDVLSKGENRLLIRAILEIVVKISVALQDKHTSFMALDILRNILYADSFESNVQNSESAFFEIVYVVQKRFPSLLSEQFVSAILSKANDPFSEYLFKYGSDFFDVDKALCKDSKYYFLRLAMIDLKQSSLCQ